MKLFKTILVHLVLIFFVIALATFGFSELAIDGLFLVLIVTFVYFIMIYVVAQIIRNNSIVDMGWGPGFVIGSWVSLLVSEKQTILSYFIVVFITIWGLRLFLRIAKRNWHKPEDFRYAQWRKSWGKNVVIIAFFRVFILQAIINFIVGSASYYIILNNQFELSGLSQWFVYLGFIFALVGLIFEVIGDEQLRIHISKGTHSLMKDGLWSLTRHPNYFGEIMIWLGLYLSGISLVINQNSSLIFYLILVVSPILMTLILVYISTPMLEKNMQKYEGWDLYVKATPMIVPFTNFMRRG